MHISCIANRLSSKSTSVSIVTTGNANAANGVLTIRQVCAALQKYADPCWWMHNMLYSHLWNVLGIPLPGEMVSQKKHKVFLDCYRLASGRASSCKSLLKCERRMETTRLKVSLMEWLVLDVSMARLSVSYHIKILVRCVPGMLAQ